jgi:hypothetical protein
LTLPASIRVNVRVPFPALVQGAAFITVAKANGIFTLTPNYELLNQSIGLDTSQILALFDTATGLWSWINALQLVTAALGSYRTVTSAGAVTVAPTDVVILLKKSPSGASTINLPASAARGGAPISIKDLTGDANTNNVTIVPAAGETIDGFSASAAAANGVAVIDVDYGFKRLYPLTSGGYYLA